AMCAHVAGLIMLWPVMSLPAFAAPKLQTFYIEAGDAALTLNEFSRQAGLQLLFDYNVVRGRQTRAIKGELEQSAALQQMLADTGLVFEYVNDRTLAITQNNHQAGPGSAVAEVTTPRRRTQSASETQSVVRQDAGSALRPEELKAA